PPTQSSFSLSTTITPPPRPPLFPYTTLFRSDTGAHLPPLQPAHRRAAHAGRSRGESGAHRQRPERPDPQPRRQDRGGDGAPDSRSEEHTSELQSHLNLVCRLLLEKKTKQTTT